MYIHNLLIIIHTYLSFPIYLLAFQLLLVRKFAMLPFFWTNKKIHFWFKILEHFRPSSFSSFIYFYSSLSSSLSFSSPSLPFSSSSFLNLFLVFSFSLSFITSRGFYLSQFSSQKSAPGQKVNKLWEFYTHTNYMGAYTCGLCIKNVCTRLSQWLHGRLESGRVRVWELTKEWNFILSFCWKIFDSIRLCFSTTIWSCQTKWQR